ncbi:hypothetical protein EMPS_01337 [Entomortierella parvispora]|uniref:Uncharacterized protein n=1 Tax=Entomortierella parvispora TaxID=205924 RepID=A0A9P3H2M8_9FUNG|nr:hypothetical protein EMPS_01337 [Entomortierella parvispora]
MRACLSDRLRAIDSWIKEIQRETHAPFSSSSPPVLPSSLSAWSSSNVRNQVDSSHAIVTSSEPPIEAIQELDAASTILFNEPYADLQELDAASTILFSEPDGVANLEEQQAASTSELDGDVTFQELDSASTILVSEPDVDLHELDTAPAILFSESDVDLEELDAGSTILFRNALNVHDRAGQFSMGLTLGTRDNSPIKSNQRRSKRPCSSRSVSGWND